MSEQDLNNEERYEMPENDLSENSENGGLVGKSPVKEIIDSAGAVDPSRFWIVFMVALILALAAVIVFAGGYLVDQGKDKDKEIVELRKELKDCPQKTLNDLKRQQQDIEDLKNSVLYNNSRIQEIKQEKLQDVKEEKEMNAKLKNITQQ